MDKGYKFLHNHPMTEKSLGLDDKHVIVDRDAWEEARRQVLNLDRPLVSNRRELLFAFLKANENQTIPDYDSNKHLMIDAFLGKQ